MWTTYWFKITGEDSYLCGEEFFTELENATRADHEKYAHELFKKEQLVCCGEVSEEEAELMGLDTF